jgi:molybdopterin converting factor small subunit
VIKLEILYIAHFSMLPGVLKETLMTSGETFRALITELDGKYKGFQDLLVDRSTGQLCLNAAIYYCEKDKVPVTVIDLDHSVEDGATITFW